MNYDSLKVLIEKRLTHILAWDCKRNTSKSKRILDPQKSIRFQRGLAKKKMRNGLAIIVIRKWLLRISKDRQMGVTSHVH